MSFAALSFAARWLLRSVVVSSIGLSSIGAVACAVACAAAPPGPRSVEEGGGEPSVTAQGPNASAPLPGDGSAASDGGTAVPRPAPQDMTSAPAARQGSLVERGLARGDGSPADEALRRGDAAWRGERWEEALELFERARSLAPQDPAPWVGIARARSRDAALVYGAAAGDASFEEVVVALDRALALQSDFTLARFEKGRVLLALGRPLEAKALLESVVEDAPEDAEAQSCLGVALLASGDVARARERFERAAQLEPDRAERFGNLATTQMMVGGVEDAVRSYRSAVRLDPNSAQYQNDLGVALLAGGDLEGAMQHLSRAVALEPRRATFLSNLAYAHLAAGRPEEALRIARRATELDPKLGSAWINRGTAEARLGRLPAARRALERALQLDPTDPRARDGLAELDELEASAAP